jgi:hypothetical protein
VQLVSASSPSHQVLGSKPSLCRISVGVRLCFGYSFPQTPLVWEPLALGLPFLIHLNSFASPFHASILISTVREIKLANMVEQLIHFAIRKKSTIHSYMFNLKYFFLIEKYNLKIGWMITRVLAIDSIYG